MNQVGEEKLFRRLENWIIFQEILLWKWHKKMRYVFKSLVRQRESMHDLIESNFALHKSFEQ